VELVG
jgi:hypothetical protein